MKAIEKERAEQHLYMTVFIVTDTGFLLNNSVGFIDLLPQSNYHPYQKTRLLRTMTVGDFLQQYTAADNRNINYTRVWIINYRRRFERGRLQPGFLIPTEEYYRICRSIIQHTMIAYVLMMFKLCNHWLQETIHFYDFILKTVPYKKLPPIPRIPFYLLNTMTQ